MYQPSHHDVPIQEAEAPATAATKAAAPAAATAAESKRDTEEQELLSKLSVLSQQEDSARLPAGALLPCLLSVKHIVLLHTTVHPSPVMATADWGSEHCTM